MNAQNYYKKQNTNPTIDICTCSKCGWKGPVSECQLVTEAFWGGAYYTVDICPKCDDGGCIDNYEISTTEVRQLNIAKAPSEKAHGR